LVLLVGLALLAANAAAQSMPLDAPASQPASATTSPASVSDDGDFAPGLGLFALFMVMAILVLVGIGAMIGLVLLCMVAVMLAAGIMSASAAIGLASRNPGTAFKAFFIQLGSLGGMVCGVGVVWLANHIFQTGLAFRWIAVIGGLGGLLAGAGVAVAFNFVWSTLLQLLVRSARK